MSDAPEGSLAEMERNFEMFRPDKEASGGRHKPTLAHVRRLFRPAIVAHDAACRARGQMYALPSGLPPATTTQADETYLVARALFDREIEALVVAYANIADWLSDRDAELANSRAALAAAQHSNWDEAERAEQLAEWLDVAYPDNPPANLLEIRSLLRRWGSGRAASPGQDG